MCVLHLLLHCPHMFIYIYISTYVYPCMSACLSINTHLCMQKYTIYHIIISFFSSLCLSLFLSWVLLSMRRAFYCMDKSKTQSFCEPRLQTVKSNLVAVGQLIAHTHTWTRQCKLGKPRNDIATWSGYENRIQIFAPKTDKSNHDICHGSVRKLRRIQCLDRIVLPWVVTLFSFVSHMPHACFAECLGWIISVGFLRMCCQSSPRWWLFPWRLIDPVVICLPNDCSLVVW